MARMCAVFCFLWSVVQVASQLNIVLIVGSAPDAVKVKNWDLSVFTTRVAINNAWQVFESWDYLIYPEDFPANRLPVLSVPTDKRLITAQEFVPQQNSYGGFVYAGGTMAFTAAYWALGALQPDLIAFVGCDMVYATEKGKQTHFYGNGTADPLRVDATLQSLEAKSARFMAMAHSQDCGVVNLSQLPESRLLFPRMSLVDFEREQKLIQTLKAQKTLCDPFSVSKALQSEQDLGYMVPSGRYWEVMSSFDKSKLSAIDSIWLEAVPT
jgi:hypothetical protein